MSKWSNDTVLDALLDKVAESTQLLVVTAQPSDRSEALAIALYCSLKFQHHFSSAVIHAVNHDGDSDSTGSITGNIVGLLHGYRQIPANWIERLELKDIILQIADELWMKYKEQAGNTQRYF